MPGAGPLAADVVPYPGVEGKPVDDDAPIGGEPDDTPLDPELDDLLFDDTPAPVAGDALLIHRNVVYWINEVGTGGTAVSGRVYLFAGLRKPTSAGTLQLIATATDAGKMVRVVCYSGGVPVTVPELVELVNGTASAGVSVDADHVRLELLDDDEVTPVPAAGPIRAVRGIELGQFRPGVYAITTEYAVAVATAADVALEADNRLEDPEDIGDWGWPIVSGAVDTSEAAPTPLADTSFFGVALRKYLVPGFVAPLRRKVALLLAFEFTSKAAA